MRKKRSVEELRELFRQRIANKQYEDLFAGGGCGFFALVLHEKLSLPLFYASPQDLDEYRHVFVMRNDECIDYLGRHPVTEIAERYAEWPDVPPRPTTSDVIRQKIKELNLGDELETELFKTAQAQFEVQKQRYL
jgi:hypothetical protein